MENELPTHDVSGAGLEAEISQRPKSKTADNFETWRSEQFVNEMWDELQGDEEELTDAVEDEEELADAVGDESVNSEASAINRLIR